MEQLLLPSGKEKKKKNTCNRMGGEEDKLGLHSRRGKTTRQVPSPWSRGANRKGIYISQEEYQGKLCSQSPVTSEKDKKSVFVEETRPVHGEILVRCWKLLPPTGHQADLGLQITFTSLNCAFPSKWQTGFTVVKEVSFEAGNILTSKNRNFKQ